MTAACPFCHPAADRLFLVTADVIGLWDAFPVSPGHALVIPKRHIATWFDATPEERAALSEATELARRKILETHDPQGFNIGINAGAAAGQTIFHLHVHVIPRYAGDVDDPRGGVRGVIPGRQNYLAAPATPTLEDPARRLIHGGDHEPLLPHLERLMAKATSVDIAVAFTMTRGMEILFPHLEDLLARGGRLRFLTGDYRESTEPEALARVLDLRGEIDARVFQTGLDRPIARPDFGRAFHPKSYILCGDDGSGVAFIGSSNISESALRHGIEWNYRINSSDDARGFAETRLQFDKLFSAPAVRPLTQEWIDAYTARRDLAIQIHPAAVEELDAEPIAIPSPHEIQIEALRALEQTRADGNQRGLVVLATGLGKTWLSAFDTDRPEFKRVLFVAHREEILDQARKTFRQVRPNAHLGSYNGTERNTDADVLFASIQTLGKANHLARFDPREFDYIVIDEFHHASAATYSRLITYFEPRFLLGLTATPERTDGGNLLSRCGENLVYRCDLAEGIRRGLLAPFHYFGVPDDIDYTNIPWRSGRFDEEALTSALATQLRAENALEQWRQRGGQKTFAFCVSQRHADFMAEHFEKNGVRSVAVHSGAKSAPRALSLERLAAGEIQILCAVDMFNEGVDVPAVDTVMMLRPTESRILWMQQLGRGLRKAEGKEHLNVIDYIGNHRSFLLKPQTLFDLQPGRQEILNFIDRYRDQELELPPGCEVTYDLETINILRGLVQGDVATVRRYYEDFRELQTVRPTASEAFHDGFSPRSVRSDYGSWFGLVRSMGDLDAESRAIVDRHGKFLDALGTTPMVKSFKMVTLLAMLNADAFPGEIGIDELAAGVMRYISSSAVLQADFEGEQNDAKSMRLSLEMNPIKAWIGGKGTGDKSYFSYDGSTFRSLFAVRDTERARFQELARELLEWRLAEYLTRPKRTESRQMVLNVKHSGGRPIIFLPDRKANPDVPEGTTPLIIEGQTYEADFVKVALNVVRRGVVGSNELPELMRAWFGSDAGLPGTRHAVILERRDDGWHLKPEKAGTSPRGFAAAKPDLAVPLPFRIVETEPGDRYRTSVPLVSLRAAAGAFGEERLDLEAVADAAESWVSWEGHKPFEPGMFVARVEGHSMEPEIKNGSYVLFRPPTAGSRQGRRVLVRAAGIEDSETGGQFTLKIYTSEKSADGDEGFRHVRITLKPANPDYPPIVLTPEDEGDVRVIGEVVEVLQAAES